MKFRDFLEVAERLVVIAAALLAVFPLYQYWRETEIRWLDRSANFITAYHACLEIENAQRRASTASVFSNPTPEIELSPELQAWVDSLDWQQYFSYELAPGDLAHVTNLCNEIDLQNRPENGWWGGAAMVVPADDQTTNGE